MLLWSSKPIISPSVGDADREKHNYGGGQSEDEMSEPDMRAPSNVSEAYDKYVTTRTPQRWRNVYANEEMAQLAT
eukprot:5052326-Amphidinium_carterae.1